MENLTKRQIDVINPTIKSVVNGFGVTLTIGNTINFENSEDYGVIIGFGINPITKVTYIVFDNEEFGEPSIDANDLIVVEPKITYNNLDKHFLSNREIIELLSSLSLRLDHSGFSRVLDVIEDLTGNRDFEL